MLIKCTGVVSATSSSVLTGLNTKFTVELRVGDIISLAGQSSSIRAILSDTMLIIMDQVTVVSVSLYIKQANPTFLTSKATKPEYEINCEITTNSIPSYSVPILLGGQVFGEGYHKAAVSLSTLSNANAAVLPIGYKYYTPSKYLNLVQVTEGSSLLKLYTSDTIVSTALNSNVITYVSGSLLTLMEGLEIIIDNNKYSILKVSSVYNYGTLHVAATLDKVVPKAMSKSLISLQSNFASQYTPGSYFLLNGKLHQVESVIGSVIKIAEPMSASAVVTIRKPLMATTYGINSVRLFNIDIPTGLLKSGSIFAVQNAHGADSLYALNSCYTELNTISRLIDGTDKLILDERHINKITGIVCIGQEANGLIDTGYTIYKDSNSLSVSTNYAFLYGETVVINDSFYTVIQAYNNTVQFDRVVTGPASTSFTVYKLGVTTFDSSALILALVNKLAEWIIPNGTKKRLSVINLQKMFQKDAYFAVNTFAEKTKRYSWLEPLHIAVESHAAPPGPYAESYAIEQAFEIGQLTMTVPVLSQCGVPIMERL